MKLVPYASLLVLLCGCSEDQIAENVTPPEINVASETPGDWSALSNMVGQTPGQSGLFSESPILVDLNALLGPSADAFRHVMADGSPLSREGPVLVTRARNGQAFLVIDPEHHALLAGIRQRNLWRTVETPGADIPRPHSVRQILLK